MTKYSFNKFKRWMDYNPPSFGTATEWRKFKESFEENAPVRYWVKYTLQGKILARISSRITNARYWVRYRTTDRYHVVDTGLSPNYYDVDTRMLHANFNLLKDFVEIEKAWFNLATDEHESSRLNFRTLFKPFRRPDLGIRHLEWEASLDNLSLPDDERSPAQAIRAREILELYNWWVNVRPNREEHSLSEYSSQGLGMLASFDDDFDKDAEDYKAYRETASLNSELRYSWAEEDDAMLIRLIKVRRGLWT